MQMSLNQIGSGGESTLSQRMVLIWVLPNALGIAAYLYLSSWTWVSSNEPGGPGDPIVWMFTSFPILAACTILNVIWIIRIFVGRGKRWRLASIWLLVVIAWFSANRYDAYRSHPSNTAEHTQGVGVAGQLH
jgi:hypothetical protein